MIATPYAAACVAMLLSLQLERLVLYANQLEETLPQSWGKLTQVGWNIVFLHSNRNLLAVFVFVISCQKFNVRLVLCANGGVCVQT